jgi:ABC-type polysaccharide/polyol phosphate export permease
VIPLASVGNCLVNLIIGFAVLLVVHAVLGGELGWSLIYFPAVFLIQFLLVAGLALLLACLNVYFRDVGYMVGVAMIFGFYASPIFYTLDMVRSRIDPASWTFRLYMLNPMVGLITAYREILFENRFPDGTLLYWPCLAALGCFIVGAVVFRRHAPVLADFL